MAGQDAVEKQKEKEKLDHMATIEVHEKALDDIVNVNSLFTLAVFVGLSFASPDQLQSLDKRRECSPGPGLAKQLILFEVISFACFLLSSLSAKSLKVLISLEKIRDRIRYKQKLKGLSFVLLSVKWRRCLLGLSIAASFTGILFLKMSMVHVIQIRVGKLSCGSDYTLKAVGSLIGIVIFALLLYAPSMVFAVFLSADKVDQSAKKVEHHETIKMQG